MKIYYWPDGVWCYSDELDHHLVSRSDDFTVAVFDDYASEEEIDETINNHTQA
jgi:hypothetical protein